MEKEQEKELTTVEELRQKLLEYYKVAANLGVPLATQDLKMIEKEKPEELVERAESIGWEITVEEDEDGEDWDAYDEDDEEEKD